jgi:hypothetical protein
MQPCSIPGCEAHVTTESLNYCRFHGLVEAQMQRDWWINEHIETKLSLESAPCTPTNDDWRAEVLTQATQQHPVGSLTAEFSLGRRFRPGDKTLSPRRAPVTHHQHGLHEPEFELSMFELATDLDSALGRLPPKHELTMRLRFGLSGSMKDPSGVPLQLDLNNEMTLEDVGHILGVTRERARQIESQSLRLLHKNKALQQHAVNWTPPPGLRHRTGAGPRP